MTEQQIEQRAEAMMDALDRAYLSTNMSTYAYETRVQEINEWEWLHRNSLTLED